MGVEDAIRHLRDDAEKQKKLSEQWPKRCGCGKIYDRRNDFRGKTTAKPLLWIDLPFAYNYKDAYATQEARHCACGSTIVVNIEIHDINAE